MSVLRLGDFVHALPEWGTTGSEGRVVAFEGDLVRVWLLPHSDDPLVDDEWLVPFAACTPIYPMPLPPRSATPHPAHERARADQEEER